MGEKRAVLFGVPLLLSVVAAVVAVAVAMHAARRAMLLRPCVWPAAVAVMAARRGKQRARCVWYCCCLWVRR